MNWNCSHCGRPIVNVLAVSGGDGLMYHPECTRGPGYKPETFQLPASPQVLLPEDSKRVADALIAAVEESKCEILNRVDAMCRQMESNNFYAEQERATRR